MKHRKFKLLLTNFTIVVMLVPTIISCSLEPKNKTSIADVDYQITAKPYPDNFLSTDSNGYNHFAAAS
jgi:hypothetical protein